MDRFVGTPLHGPSRSTKTQYHDLDALLLASNNDEARVVSSHESTFRELRPEDWAPRAAAREEEREAYEERLRASLMRKKALGLLSGSALHAAVTEAPDPLLVRLPRGLGAGAPADVPERGLARVVVELEEEEEDEVQRDALGRRRNPFEHLLEQDSRDARESSRSTWLDGSPLPAGFRNARPRRRRPPGPSGGPPTGVSPAPTSTSTALQIKFHVSESRRVSRWDRREPMTAATAAAAAEPARASGTWRARLVGTWIPHPTLRQRLGLRSLAPAETSLSRRVLLPEDVGAFLAPDDASADRFRVLSDTEEEEEEEASGTPPPTRERARRSTRHRRRRSRSREEEREDCWRKRRRRERRRREKRSDARRRSRSRD